MVRINRVYTRAGDTGQTSLIGGERASKACQRIECYGTVDELNAVIGLVRTALDESPAQTVLGPILVPVFKRIQNELFNLGAQLATPDPDMRAKMPAIAERHVTALENVIDELNEDLPDLRSFVLPGGGWVSSYCHLARTICRRAERNAVALAADEAVDALSLTYLNRLSDALFVIGRYAVIREGREEPLWEPEKT
ncbi:MAG: cob(I)yrinic acid a,c-diamide adenosyltransferase [Myxococcota bacterium]